MDYAGAIEAHGNDYAIKKAIAEKRLYRLEEGVYSTTPIVSEEAIICFKYPRGVLALSSAFFFHNLTDVTPDYYELATSRDAPKIHDPRVRQIFSSPELLDVGKTNYQKNGAVTVYDLERSIVDLLRYKTKLPYDYYKEIIKNLRLRVGEIDIRKLQNYISKMPKADHLMKMMMEEIL